MQIEKIDIAEKFKRFTEHWRPEVVIELTAGQAAVVLT